MRQVISIAVVLSLAGCGEVVTGDPDGGTDGQQAGPCDGSTIAMEDFFGCVSQLVCRVYTDCLGSDTAHLDCDNLPIQVLGNLPPGAIETVLAAASGSGRLQWNGTAAKTCLDQLEAGGCRVFKDGNDPFERCGIVVGNVNNGQPCQNEVECATPGARCEPDNGQPACTGRVCQAPSATNASCANGGFCRPDDHCVQTRDANGTDTSTCRTGDVGQQCDYHGDCDSGLYCNGGANDGTGAGICTASKPSGSTCLDDEECQGELMCVGNNQPLSGTCREVRSSGAQCDSVFGGCFGDQYCDIPTGQSLGTCTAAPNLGDACAVVGGQPVYCGVFMACEGGHCTAPGNVGDVCTTSNLYGIGSTDPNGCNLGLFCDRDLTGQLSGSCRAPQSNGAVCVTEGHCDSGYCGGGTCQTYPTCSF